MQRGCYSFYNHHVWKEKLKSALESAKLRALVIKAQMQWGTIQGLRQSLLYAENVLNSIVSEKGFVFGTTKQKEKRSRDQGYSDCSRLSDQFGKMFGHPQAN